MSWRRPHRARNSDEVALRRAALRVGVQIAGAVAVVVVLLLAGAAVFLWAKSQPAEVLSHLQRSEPQVVLDIVDVLGILVVGGIAGIVLGGVVGVLSARRAVRPLGEALALQRRFVQDASHELRTPLAVLDTRIQLAQKRLGPDSDAAEVLAELRSDSASLAAVIEDLLHGVAGSGPDLTESPTDLAELARTVVADLEVMALDRGINLAVEATDEPVPVAVAAPAVRRVIVALADNALKYTPEGGRVTVSVRTATAQGATATGRGTMALLTVADTGPGISGPSPERVFERFSRGGTTARLDARRSYGIGLALVREIAVRNGGSVRIAETGAGGTTMEVALPLAISK
ncbi:sensor histidine kinase [Sinomonas susongensis]|uniref:sensor histidine kinase n=1 Tax=Sinomonas susongensis TaxID=1324851 RepID=UPI0011093271|nr:HAMP domain-containing sensor histidine kinase [Sinomonas susongensis]